MARAVTPRKPKAQPETPLEVMLREYMQALAIQNYPENTISNRTFHLVAFIRWCHERGLAEPLEVTRPVLERYQRYLFHYRKKNGDPMSFRTQHSRLVPLRMWFRWMTRRNYLLHNPASELELPKLGQPLPREHPLRPGGRAHPAALRHRRSHRVARPGHHRSPLLDRHPAHGSDRVEAL